MGKSSLPITEEFLEFLTKAQRVIHPLKVSAAKPKLTENFISFVKKAKTFIDNPAAETAVAATFQHFVEQAMPQMFSEIQKLLPQIAERANLISRWLVKDDLLAVAGCRFVEDAYTELIAWRSGPRRIPHPSFIDNPHGSHLLVWTQPSVGALQVSHIPKCGPKMASPTS